MTPLRRLYVAELWKLLKRPMTWALAVILVVLMVLVYGTLVATLLVPESARVDIEAGTGLGGLEESLLLPEGLFMGIGLVQLLVSALVIVLAAGMVGSDLSWGTIRTMLTMGAGRVPILIAKLFALITMGVAGIAFGLALAILGSIATGYAVGEGSLASEWVTADFLVDALVVGGRALVGVALWGVIAGTVTLITRSLAAGLAASLALMFLGGQIGSLLGQLGDVGLWLGRALPGAGIDALTLLNSSTAPVYGMGDWLWILGSIAGWFLLMATLAVLNFRRMDTLAAGSS